MTTLTATQYALKVHPFSGFSVINLTKIMETVSQTFPIFKILYKIAPPDIR